MANFLLRIAPDSVINELTSNNTSIVVEKALIASCEEGYFGLVKYITRIGKWLIVDNTTTKLARCYDNLHIVKYLLTHCQCTMPDDMSEVHIACIQGDVETVKTALDSNEASILLRVTDRFGVTPMHYAILEPNLLKKIVQYAGGMLLNVTDIMGNTPLHHSIKYECIQSVTILVEAPGCDVNLANFEGETPLIVACKYSNSDIVRLLVGSERCDLNISDSNGQTALHIACDSGHLDVVQYLVNRKECAVTMEDMYGYSPLMLSFINEHWEVVNFLLQTAPDSVINQLEVLLTTYDMSIVMELVEEGLIASCKESYFGLFEYLIKNKWYIVNLKEITQLARYSDNLHFVKYLLTHCHCTMPDDMSEVHIACIQGNVGKVKAALDSNGSSLLGAADHLATTPMHYAILEPNLLKIIVQYAGGMLLNITDGKGNTPLHHSIKYECIESVKIIVESPGCDVNLANLKGETPLIAACKYSNSDVFQLLLKCERCDLNVYDSEGNTALHIVVSSDSNGRLEKVQCLLQSDRCDANVINKSGYTPLHIVCRRGDIPLLEALLTDKRCDLNIQDDNEDTALHIGVENVKVVKCLLESGRSRCDIYNKKGLTPFHKAIANGDIASVEVMMKNDKTSNDKFQNSPIHIACIHSRLDILKVLLGSTNCDPNQQNVVGDTALHIVCRMKTGTEVEFLEVFTSTPRINPTLLNLKGNAPIHTACMNSRLESLKCLLSCESCDLNQQNTRGDTALHIVCRMRTGDELQFLELLTSTPGINLMLVNHEGIAPCDVVDNDGNTLLHFACAEGNTALVELLVKNGANILKPDVHGDTPLHVACKHSKPDILKFLLGCRNCDHNQNADGDIPIHIVSRMGDNSEQKEKSKTVELLELLVKNGADILKPNRHGDAPIHIACKHSRLDTLGAILDCTNCDPNQLNAKGDTALHIVSKMRTGKELKFFEVLISKPRINPKITNHEGITPCDVVGNDGNTLLHIACTEGNTAMVELLVKNGADILRPDSHGDAPIHIACRHFKLDILKLLLAFRICNSNQQSSNGDTALHIVCRMTNQQNVSGDTVLHALCKMRVDSALQFLQTLISTPEIDPETVNHEGLTPIEVAGTNYSAIETIKKFLDHKRSSIQAYLKIFVVGNSGTGKSTLIKAVTAEASQLRKYAPLSKMKYVNPSDVPPHTAGIVPIPFNSKHFGNSVLYDFAGQYEYYSSHAAVMENLILPSPPLFLLLIDISKSKEVIREELVYWWHFINNQSQKAAAPPHVILAGSHKDMVKSRDREDVEIMIRDCIKAIPVSFEFVGYFSLDCRKLVSQGLNTLLSQLNTTCQVLRRIVDDNLHCHILNALLSTHDSIYCRAVDIMNRIESDDAPLPKTFSQFVPLLKSLNDQGHVLLLQNHTDESKSWVILKPDVLLAEVNGSVFAPEGFKEHFQFAMSTGVVTSSKLKQKFTVYDHDVIVEYMTHLEFCFRIKDQHTLDMITNNAVYESAATEEYYFFPALVRVKNPTNVCQPQQSIGYECGWLYKCHKETEQLTTRFLHVLILRLAFACEPPDDPIETESVVLLRSCSVWKHGIAWWTNDGIEVVVEVGLQCHWVAVMMRCPATERVQCAELRSKVIFTVQKTKTDFCPAITMKEYLIDPLSLKYPFEGRELILYSMSEVAKVTIKGKKYAKDTKGDNLISLPQLLPFEPYNNMGDLIWKFFRGDKTVAVTPEELMQLAEKCHDQLAEFKTAFKPDISSFQRDCEKADCTEVERCIALFHILQRRGRFKTWRDFQQEFSRFSIFCEQSPLVRIMYNHLFTTL